jgi:outer membrane receptor protein involved in Fe transport
MRSQILHRLATASVTVASAVLSTTCMATMVGAPVAEPAAAGLRFSAPSPLGERLTANEVQWRREREASQWSARVSVGEATPARALNGEVQWLYLGLDGHVLAIGAVAQRELQIQGSASVAGAVSSANPRLGAYVNNEWQLLPDWRLVFGARADRSPGGAQALAPRAALLWQAWPGLQLKLLDGVALREPGASLSPLRDLVPQVNPSLANERLRATELALDWRLSSPLRLAASFYRNGAGKPSDAVVMAAAKDPLQFQNLGRANGNGIELGGDFAADAGWQLGGSWAASQARDGEPAWTDVPRTLAKLQASALLPWRGARAALEWWRLGQQGSALDAQSLINATMDWAPLGSAWTVAASAYNLTGRTLASAASADAVQGALLRDGRRLQLQLARAF